MEEKRGNPLRCPDCGGFGSYAKNGYCGKCYDRVSNDTNDLYVKTDIYPGSGYGIKTSDSFFREEHGTVEDYGALDEQYGWEKRG